MMTKIKAFTLIELVITIVIMSIIMVVILINLPSTSTMQNQNTADILRADLYLTKILSMSTNQRCRIAISSNAYQIQDQDGNPIPHPETGAISTIFPEGTSIAPQQTLIFDSMGEPYIGNTAMTSPLRITISTSSSTSTITVSPETGFIQ